MKVILVIRCLLVSGKDQYGRHWLQFYTTDVLSSVYKISMPRPNGLQGYESAYLICNSSKNEEKRRWGRNKVNNYLFSSVHHEKRTGDERFSLFLYRCQYFVKKAICNVIIVRSRKQKIHAKTSAKMRPSVPPPPLI